MSEDNTPPQDETLSSDEIALVPDDLLGVGGVRRPLTLRSGEVVGHRYRIVRFIAEGGIGEVYEAEDLELGGHVALKTLKAGLGASETTTARFRREVQLARRVTHPNVCRTFDSFVHVVRDDEGTEMAQILVVSMELLEGETLSERLVREGALPVDVALPIVRQVVAGLRAAHESGVIHRDLKARNIILANGEDGVRAVITDFGLARPTDSRGDPTLTDAGALVGTPAYMAPEQILGRDVTKSSDIYSLGVVIYELVTGERPFDGGTPISIAVQRLKGPPRSPAALKTDLPRRWEEGILRCLELEPSARYESADEVVEALEGREVTKALSRGRNKTLRRQVFERVVALAILLTTLVLVGIAVSRRVSRAPKPEAVRNVSNAAVMARRSIAILPFHSLSGDEASKWISAAIAELLRDEVAAADSLRLVPAADVARASLEIGLSNDATPSRDALGKLEKLLVTDLILEGSFLRAPGGGEVRVDMRLVNPGSGEVVDAVSESSVDGKLSGIASALGERIRAQLGARPLDDRGRGALAAGRPKSETVLSLYAKGIQRVNAFDEREGVALLQEAVRLEPTFAPAYAELSDAWMDLGLRREAVSAAETAVELSGDLRRAERLLNDGRLALAKRDFSRAIEVYQALFRFYPDELPYGIALARAQISAGRLEDAEDTIASLWSMPSDIGRDPRIDLAAADVERSRGDFTAMASYARAATHRARETGARILAARGDLIRASALRDLGRHDDARAMSSRARETFKEVGDRRGAADATALVGSIDYHSGRYDEAEVVLGEALAALLDAGDVGRAAFVANLAGAIPFVEGRLAEAEAAMRRANALAKRAGDDQIDAATLINLSELREVSGYGDEAIGLSEGLVARAEGEGNDLLRGGSLLMLGRAELCRGRIGRSRDVLRDAIATLARVNSLRYEAYAHELLGAVELQAGNLDDAEKSAERSLEIREGQAERDLIGESRILLGEIALAGNDPITAEMHARAGLKAVEGGFARPMETVARDLLARALLESGEIEKARKTLEGVDVRHEENPHIRIAVTRTRALIDAAAGKRKSALDLLADAEMQARQFGIVPERLAVEFAALRIRMAEDPTNAETLRALAKLESEASSLGFGLVATNVARLLGKPAGANAG